MFKFSHKSRKLRLDSIQISLTSERRDLCDETAQYVTNDDDNFLSIISRHRHTSRAADAIQAIRRKKINGTLESSRVLKDEKILTKVFIV